MSPNLKITDYQLRQAKGQCVQECCPADAAPGSDYCVPHGEAKRARDRRWVKARRKARRAERKCAGCGKPSKRWRCPACYRKWKAVSVGKRERSVGKLAGDPGRRGATVIEQRTDGRRPTERYVGRSRRGAPSIEDQLRDLLIDAKAAIRDKGERYIQNLERALTEGVANMGRVDRERWLRMYAEPGARACRMLAGGVLKLDPDADVLPAEDFDPDEG